LADWLAGGLVGWLVGWLAGWLAGWLVVESPSACIVTSPEIAQVVRFTETKN